MSGPGAPAAPAAGRRFHLDLQKYGVLLIGIALFVFLAATEPSFATTRNLLNLLDQWAPTLIVACGATVVIIAGGFDLSAGAVYGVAGVVAIAVANLLGIPVGIAAGLVFGLLIGLANGLITSALRVHSFLVTLAMALVLKGGALAAMAGSTSVLAESRGFRDIARTEIGEARITIIFALIAVVAVGWLLARSRFGEQVRSVGSNEFAARVAGVRVKSVRTFAFGISGLLAAAAGIIGAARSSSGQVAAGEGIEFVAITAVVLGGTRLFGGAGSTWRTTVGVLLLAMIANGINLSDIDSTYQQVIVGGLLLGIVAFDSRVSSR